MCLFVFLFLSGCAHYLNEKNITTTTQYADGRIVTIVDSCVTRIDSMREVEAGRLRVSEFCTLDGGANGMTFNYDGIKAIAQILKAVMGP